MLWSRPCMNAGLRYRSGTRKIQQSKRYVNEDQQSTPPRRNATVAAYNGFEMQPAPAKCRERTVLEGRYRADFKVYVAAVRSLESPSNQKALRPDVPERRTSKEGV